MPAWACQRHTDLTKGMRRTIVDNKDDGLYKSVDFNHCLDDDDGLRDHLDVLCLDG